MKRTWSIIGAVGALAVAALTSAGPAQAGTVYEPSDCKGTSSVSTMTMTCTARPAGQQWQSHFMQCQLGGSDFDIYGTIVTGNGTSTSQTCADFPHAISTLHIISFSDTDLQPPGAG